MKLISVREDVGIKNITEFYRELAQVLGEENDVVLDFSKVRRIDLSVAQVLMAAQKRARDEKRAIRLKRIAPSVREQLVLMGLAR